MKKNEDDQIIVFRLQEKVKYWWFFDVYGSTMKICAFSGVPVPGKLSKVNFMTISECNVLISFIQ